MLILGLICIIVGGYLFLYNVNNEYNSSILPEVMGIIMVFLGMLFTTIGADKQRCYDKWEESNIEFKYQGMCKVKVNGVWMPDKHYHVYDNNQIEAK
jgi:hypothetical protein